MLKTRTIGEVFFVCLLLFSIVFSSILSGNRIITSTGDNVDTFLRNSKGNYWTVSQPNLQTAIWDCNSTHGGWVQLPQSHGLTLTGLSNPWNVALINLTGYNSTKWSATSALVASKSAAWNASSTNTIQPFAYLWNATRTLVAAKSAAWNASNATFIHNSKGNYWTATGANLQKAIYDIGNNTGSVDVPAIPLLITSTIVGTKKCNIDFHGATLYATTDVDILYVKPQQTINNLNINVSQVAVYTKACITLNGSDSFHMYYNSSKLNNINLYGGNTQDGTGLLLTAPTSGTLVCISFCEFNNVYISGFYRGIYIRNQWNTVVGGGAFINGNIFKGITGTKCDYFIFLDNKENEGASETFSSTSGNQFCNIDYQPSTGTDTYFASIEGNKNTFDNIVVWDWAAFGDSTNTIRINFTGNSTTIKNYFSGGSSNPDSYILDNGAYNSYMTSNYIKMQGSNAPGLNITHINRYQRSSTTGVKFYASTLISPFTYFYGYATGSAAVRYATFRVDSKGSLEVATQQSGIDLEPNSGVVNITSVLQLSKRTTHPIPASEGMIYYNDTLNLLEIYTDAWHTINIT